MHRVLLMETYGRRFGKGVGLRELTSMLTTPTRQSPGDATNFSCTSTLINQDCQRFTLTHLSRGPSDLASEYRPNVGNLLSIVYRVAQCDFISSVPRKTVGTFIGFTEFC